MAWTQPSTTDWTTNLVVTASLMNTRLRDNLISIGDVHNHGSSTGSGAGSRSLGPVTRIDFSTQASPSTAGRVRRVGAHLQYYGTQLIRITEADAASTEASPRTLGAGASQAARGTHTHTPTNIGSSMTTWSVAMGYSALGLGLSSTYVTHVSATRTPGAAKRTLVVTFGVVAYNTDGASTKNLLMRILKDSVQVAETTMAMPPSTRRQVGLPYVDLSPTVASHTYEGQIKRTGNQNIIVVAGPPLAVVEVKQT